MGYLNKEEQEVNIIKTADENEFDVYISDPKYIRKFKKIGIEPYKIDTIEGEVVSCYYKLPLNQLVLKGKPIPRKYTDEQRLAMVERMNEARKLKT